MPQSQFNLKMYWKEVRTVQKEDEWCQKISKRILSLMDERNMSKEELAKESGLSVEIISTWLSADFKSRWITDIVSISDALSVKPEYLLTAVGTGKGNKK